MIKKERVDYRITQPLTIYVVHKNKRVAGEIRKKEKLWLNIQLDKIRAIEMLFAKQKLKEIQNNSQIMPPDYFLIGTHTSEKVKII